MKKRFNNWIALVLVLVPVLGFSKDNQPRVRVNQVEKDVIAVYIQDTDLNALVLKDKNGKVLYSESLTGIHYAKKLNLENLPEGLYFLIYENEDMIKTIPVEINKTNIDIQKEQVKYFNKPEVLANGNSVYLKLESMKDTYLNIRVIDERKDEVFSEDHVRSHKNRKYDFSNVPKGNYEFEIYSQGKWYSYQFSIN